MRAYRALCFLFLFHHQSVYDFFSSSMFLFCPYLFFRCVLDTAAWDGLSEVCVSEKRLHRPPRRSSDKCYSSALVAAIYYFLWPRHPKPGESPVGHRQHLGGRVRHQPVHSAWHLWWWWVCLFWCNQKTQLTCHDEWIHALEICDSSSSSLFMSVPFTRGRFSRGKLEFLPERCAHSWLLWKPLVPPVLAKQEPRQDTQHPGHSRTHSATWIYSTV